MAKIEMQKRKFIKYSTLGLVGLFIGGGMIFSPLILKGENRLRPPGAIDEEKFLGLCIKCGQCLQVCPYHSIKLSDIAKGSGIGTPYIDANERGCYACEAVPCVLACPSGALDHSCERPEDIKMGVAVLEFPDTCLATTNTPLPNGYAKKIKEFTKDVRNVTQLELDVISHIDEFEGQQCSLCADMCPIPSPISAISMVNFKDGKKPEIYSGCIGCGVCQEVCPTSTPSIIIKPRTTYEKYYNKA